MREIAYGEVEEQARVACHAVPGARGNVALLPGPCPPHRQREEESGHSNNNNNNTLQQITVRKVLVLSDTVDSFGTL